MIFYCPNCNESKAPEQVQAVVDKEKVFVNPAKPEETQTQGPVFQCRKCGAVVDAKPE